MRTLAILACVFAMKLAAPAAAKSIETSYRDGVEARRTVEAMTGAKNMVPMAWM